jgi:hypothetical protein
MQLEFIYDSLHGSVEKGNAAVVAQIMLGGLTPGIVSYYWSAALQYDAPSIRASSWAPSLVLGMVMLFGYGLYVALLFTALGAAWMWPDGIDLSILVVLVLALALGISAGFLVLLAMSGIAVAIYAWAGAYAIDRVRGFEPTPYILAALLVATLPQQLAVLALFRWVLHAPISLPDVLMLFPSTFFWVLGLWASGFPALVRRGIPVQGEVPAYGP